LTDDAITLLHKRIELLESVVAGLLTHQHYNDIDEVSPPIYLTAPGKGFSRHVTKSYGYAAGIARTGVADHDH
jgi:hypothetical protein